MQLTLRIKLSSSPCRQLCFPHLAAYAFAHPASLVVDPLSSLLACQPLAADLRFSVGAHMLLKKMGWYESR